MEPAAVVLIAVGAALGALALSYFVGHLLAFLAEDREVTPMHTRRKPPAATRAQAQAADAPSTTTVSEELTPEEGTPIEEVYRRVAEELGEGKSKQEAVTQLVSRGMDKHDASQFVDQVQQALNQYRESPEARRIMAGKYARHMLFGALWVIGGTIVTLWTYNAAGPGGTYIVAWGAIGFGAIDFLWGLFNWLRYSV